MGCLWVDGGPIDPLLVLSLPLVLLVLLVLPIVLVLKREERPRQRGRKGEVLATMSAGIAIFRFSKNNYAIWPNSYQRPMQFDQFATSSKLRLSWAGVRSLQSPPKLHIGWGSSPHGVICCTSPSTHTVG
jgi:hypothetical protein